jgi:integrase
MAIRKRPGSNIWQIDISIGDRRIQRSAATADRVQAQELHDEIRAQLWREVNLGERPRFTWKDAVKLYLSERQHLRSMHHTLFPQIEWLNRRIAPDTPLLQINREAITRLRMARAEHEYRGKKPKQATVNHQMAVLSSVLNLARRHGMIEAVPAIEMPNPENARTRWATRQESDLMLSRLTGVLKAAVEYSLESGCRQDNVINMRWSWVRLDQRTVTIPANDFKGKRSHTYPLSDRAHQILIEQRGNDGEFVFVEDGKPIKNPNEKLKRVLATVGITDFHWHDLRHTWATWHVRAGTPLEVLQKLGGWRDYHMVLRYAQFEQDHLATYANQLRRDIPATDERKVVAIR